MEESLKVVKWKYRLYSCRLHRISPSAVFTGSFEIFFLEANFVLKSTGCRGVQIQLICCGLQLTSACVFAPFSYAVRCCGGAAAARCSLFGFIEMR